MSPGRWSRRLVLSLLSLAFVVASPSHARADKPAYKPNELLIKFRQGIHASERNQVLSDLGATKIRGFDRIRVEHVRIKSTVDKALRRYRRHPLVEYVEPNYIYKAVVTPNDPMLDSLWGLANEGQTGGTPGADISALQAWDVTRGDSAVLVGVIDTGIDYTHPDLAANMYTNPNEIPGNLVDDDHNGFVDDVRGWDFVNNDNNPMDDYGHGTHCAGTIGAVGNNGVGVVGVNWTVRMVAIKFLDAFGSGTTDGAIASVEYATTIGVRVINASWGGGGFSQALNDAIAEGGAQGILFVAAAGNAGMNVDLTPFYPAAYPLDNIVSVAATTHTDGLAGFSNYGINTVDIGAPGQDILSTLPSGSYGIYSGTSMAAPHVVGALSLVFARYPGIPGLDAKQLILDRGDPVPALAGRVGAGKRLNALLPVAANDSLPPGSVTNLSVTDVGGTEATLGWTAPGDDESSGTASSYDVRYSTAPIDDGNFALATQVPGEPNPEVAGTYQQMVVRGLAFATRYHFAMKTRDELGNLSPLSNVPDALTMDPPDIAVSPDSLTADLLTGASTTRTITVANSGVSDLVFAVSVDGLGGPIAVDAIAPAGYHGEVIASGSPISLGRIADDPQPIPLRLDVPAPIDRGSASVRPAAGPGRTILSPLEEVFGGPENAFLGDFRSRGNIFQCSTPRRLVEHRFYLAPQGTGPVWFLVYEGDSAIGTFDLTSASSLTITQATAGWYSSGPIEQPLEEGRHYMIVAAFQPPSEYRNRIGISPYPVQASFGSLTAGAGWDWAPETQFPPPAQQNVPGYAYGNPVAYWQTLVTQDAITWVRLDADSGNVPAGSQVDLTVTLDATGLNGGDYRANVVVSSNDPDESEAVVPVHLHVTGAPDIQLDVLALDFGTPFIGAVISRDVEVRNAGTDLLTISGISTSPGQYSAPDTGFSLAPGESRVVTVQFAPVAPGVVDGMLTVSSDDPDEPSLQVSLHGEGLIAPDVAVSPDSLYAELTPNQSVTRTVTIRNDGGSPLVWSAASEYRGVPSLLDAPAAVAMPPGAAVTKNEAPPVGQRPPGETYSAVVPASQPPAQVATNPDLESVRDALDLQFGSITGVIPYRFDFTEGEAGEAIYDGGNDMYDYGNLLSTELGGYLSYTNGPVLSSPFLGAGGRYFTRKYPGLFVLGADLSTTQFMINGNVGADGGGSVDGAVLEVARGGHTYRAFVKRIFNAYDPSVNHMIVVRDPAAASHQYALNTDDDYHRVYGLSSPRLYYLLYAAEYGGYIGNSETTTILERFLDVIDVMPEWLSVSPDSGVVPAGETASLDVRMEAGELLGGYYDADVVVTSNDPDESQARVGVRMRVIGQPDITVTPLSLDLGAWFIGLTARDSVRVRNAGNDVLTITNVAVAPGEFTSAPSVGFALLPGQTRDFQVSFSPTSPGVVTGSLTIESDDPDESTVVVGLRGEGLIPPDVDVSPDSLYAGLEPNQGVTRVVTITNVSGSPLAWSAAARFRGTTVVAESGSQVATSGTGTSGATPTVGTRAPGQTYVASVPAAPEPGTLAAERPLEHVLEGLNSLHDHVTSAIPNRYDFSEGESGEAIFDGGNDMYNYGNVLATNLGGPLLYTNGPIVASPYLGPGGRYFTRKYPGLFVFAGDLPESTVNAFAIYGYLGADGVGSADGAVLETTRDGHVWRAFVKRVFNATDPSVNHMIVVRDPDNASHQYSLYTGDDYHAVYSLSSPRLYYALYAGAMGSYIDNPQTMTIFERFLDAISGVPSWLSVSPDSGVVPAGQSQHVDVRMEAGELLAGNYDADLVVESNDPDEPESLVGVRMLVLGRPDIAVTPTSLDLGSLFIGLTARDSVRVRNGGNDLLTVSGVAAAPGSFTALGGGFQLAPGATRDIVVRFAPVAAGVVNGTLTIQSNDPDEASVVVTLRGEGIVPPDIDVSPDSLYAELTPNQGVTREVTIRNEGESPLVWTASAENQSAPSVIESAQPVAMSPDAAVTKEHAPPAGARAPGETYIATVPAAAAPIVVRSEGSLESVRDGLDLAFGSITGVIPDRFDFFEGESGIAISDGGYDMYDGGNFLSTELGGYLEYTNGPIVSSPYLGASGRHFTRKYPGLFVLGADLSTSQFTISGNVGADGGGSVDGAVLEVSRGGHTWRAFVKRIYNAYDPSVNHLIVVRDPGAASHQYALNTDDDYHSVTGLSSPRLYYLLYAGFNGRYIGNAETMTILDRFLDAINVSPEWLSVSPDSGVVPPGDVATVNVRMEAGELLGGFYDADIVVASNDPDESETRVGVRMRVIGQPDITAAPASIDFGSLFIGSSVWDSVAVRNAGNDLLTVTSVTAAPGVFITLGTGFTLAPGATRLLPVRFMPAAAGVVTGALTIHSDDPDEPALAVQLQGEGLIPPDLSVTPPALDERLYTNEQVVRMLHVENLGGSDLVFQAVVTGPGSQPALIVQPESIEPVENDVDSRSAPANWVAQASTPRVTFGTGALLVQDILPWGSNAIEVILNANHIDYDRITSGMLASTDLSRYHLVIVASDQTYQTYYTLAAQAAQLSQFVTQGGVLEFHAAGFGFGGGDPSVVPLPGGLRIVNSFAMNNQVLLPQHPLVAGVPPTFTGTFASHAGFTSVPAGAEIVARDEFGVPNLVTYTFGLGHVVSSGQTLEFGYQNNQHAGRILQNMIPWAHALSPPWVRIGLTNGVVPAGGSLDIPVTLDATDLDPGDYAARILLTSNDPDEALVTVPVSLHVIGAPMLTVDPLSINFGSVYVGATDHDSVRVGNAGTEPLNVSLLSTTPADFGVTPTSFVLSPGTQRVVRLTFTPTEAGPVAGTLVITSDDPRTPNFEVPLSGAGLPPPDIASAPDSLHALVQPGEIGTRTLKLWNRGTGPLAWTAASQFRSEALSVVPSMVSISTGERSTRSAVVTDGTGDDRVYTVSVPAAPPPAVMAEEATLESVLEALDENYSWVTGVIPNRFDFTEGVTGVSIADGGANLYDTGNYLNTNIDGPLSYSDGVIRTSPMLGAAGRYFTRKHPGLFVLAADIADIRELWIGGNLGADGLGSADGEVLNIERSGHVWRGFVKRVHGASMPSVNHLVVIRDPGSASHAFAASTNDDYHRISNLHVPRLYYLLFSSRNGGFVDYNALLTIMERFVQVVDLGPTWLEPIPGSGVVAPGDSTEIQVRCNANALPSGRYDAQIGLSSNDPDRGFFTVPVRLDVQPMARLALSPRDLDFGQVMVGASEVRQLWLKNTGSLSLQVTSIQASRADYQVSPGPWTVTPSDSVAVTITGRPLGVGDCSGSLTIASNDPLSPASAALAMIGTPRPVTIDLDLDPNHLQLGSPHMGRWVTAYLEPPLPLRAQDIVLESIRLNGTLSIDPSAPHTIGDDDHDGIPDLMVKFSRLSLALLLGSSASAPVQVTGTIGTEAFEANDVVDARSGRITRPAAGDVLAAGAPYTIQYEPLSGGNAQWIAVLHSMDDGATWVQDARVRSQGNAVPWTAPKAEGAEVILALIEVEQNSVDSVDVTGVLALSGPFHLANSLAAPGASQPLSLAPVIPNPAVGTLRFRFVLPAEQAAELAVFDIGGRKVRTLTEGIRAAGSHEIVWRGDDDAGRIAPAGVYIVKLSTESGVRMRRFGRIR